MRVERIIWLPEIEEKLWVKHDLSIAEVEDVLFGKPFIKFVEHGHRPNENLYAASGRSQDGRYLIIFFIYKENQEALIISGRDMDRKERKNYERKRK
jgi:uncharacterized DUF497 family protein